MLYLKEIYYRLVFILFSFLICLFIIYIYKEEIVFIIILPSWLSKFPIEYFIFTEPKEIFLFYLSCFLFVGSLFVFPLIIYSVYEYLRPALYKDEDTKLSKIKVYFNKIYFISNMFIFFVFIPIFWNFFSSFDKHSDLILFFLELSAINYFNFLFSIFIMSNVLIIFLFILLKIFLNKGISFILEIKKYLIFLFLIFSTVITPPELELQIFMFVFLYVSLEIVIFINLILTIYKLKIIKVTN
jgi:sec-independent protein translocase protein TatC